MKSTKKFIMTRPVFIFSTQCWAQPQEGSAASGWEAQPQLPAHCNSHSHPVPLVISLFSVRPPQREMAMEGKSRIPSEVLSAPLSTPELPADCGEWLAGRSPMSAALLLWALSPLQKKNQEFSLHCSFPDSLPLTSTVYTWYMLRGKKREKIKKNLCLNFKAKQNQKI